MKKNCDLHTHSVFSDGTCTPTQIVDAAVGLGLTHVVLCDHNTVAGLDEFLSASSGKDITAIPGVEFSTRVFDTDVHLLGLFIDSRFYGDVSELVGEFDIKKEQSNIELIHSLRKLGYDLSFEELKSSTVTGKFNRAHIARALWNKGYVPSMDDAFKQLLNPNVGIYKEPERPSFFEMLSFIRSIEAVPVLAHPYVSLTSSMLGELLPKAKKAGLAGMECAYPLYSATTMQFAMETANAYGLLPSGGSDFHGDNKPDIDLGTGKGNNLSVPSSWAEALTAYKREKL